MTRSCRRSPCHRPAAATLTFSYQTAEVRLGDLEGEAHPLRWELCPTHAARLTVPRGWAFVDERSPELVAAAELAQPPSGEGAARRGRGADARSGDRSARAARVGSPGQASAGCAGGSRYAALQAELPRLAAEFARGDLGSPADHDDAHGSGAGMPQRGDGAAPPQLDERRGRPTGPIPTRDLSGLWHADVPRQDPPM